MEPAVLVAEVTHQCLVNVRHGRYGWRPNDGSAWLAFCLESWKEEMERLDNVAPMFVGDMLHAIGEVHAVGYKEGCRNGRESGRDKSAPPKISGEQCDDK